MDALTEANDDLRHRYIVQQVTDFQASWAEGSPGVEGNFALQLILDHGAEAYILRPTEDDMDVILKLLAKSRHTSFDLDRKVLMFSNLRV